MVKNEIAVDGFYVDGQYVENKIEFQEEPKDKINLRELTDSGILNEYIQYSADYATNPDDLIDTKGWDYLKEMVADDTIHSCLEVRKMGRLSTNWKIVPASESPEDKKIAEFVKYNFMRMDGTLGNILKDIYSAFEYGFSVSEKNYQQYPDGEWKGYIGYKSIKTRDPKHIEFKIDKHGNVESAVQKKDYISTLKNDIYIPRDKCIIYTPNAKFANPYGEPELKFVFKPYLAKKWVVRFWNIALERFGAGLAIGTFPAGDEAQKDYLLSVLSNLQAKTSIVKEEGIDIDFKNPMVGGKMAYEFALEKHETAIARALLIPDLLGFSKFTKGSFALGKKHFDVFLWRIKKDGNDTEEIIVDEQMIKQLVWINFHTETIPHFKFDPITEEDKMGLLEKWNDLTDSRVVTSTPEDEVHIRNLMRFPDRSLSDIEADKEERDKKAEEIKQQIQQNQNQNQNNQNFNNQNQEKKKPGEFAENTKKFKVQKVIKFQEIAQDWDEIENAAIAELEAIFQKSKEGFYKDVDRKQLLNVDNPPSPTDIDKLQLKYKGEIKKTVRNALLLGYLYKRASAINEMRQVSDIAAGVFKKEIPIPVLKLTGDFNLQAEKAIEHFTKKMIIRRAELGVYTRKAFTITGVESEKILGEAKNILYKHLATGNRQRTEKALRKLWSKYETTGALTRSGELSTAHRIDTIIRTNVAESMSEGRRAMYEDPDIADDIVAYSVDVTLDDRTTPYCESLVGKSWSKEEFIFPPYHFDCRTEPIEIHKGEEHTLKNWKESPYEFY